MTDEGGMTSHAAIVSRELGIPCIVGTKTGTQVLQTGQDVTVDAREGVVYSGKRQVSPTPPSPPAAMSSTRIVTGTRLYVNLAQPEMAEAVAARDVDGVGLLRAEFIMQTVTWRHASTTVHRRWPGGSAARQIGGNTFIALRAPSIRARSFTARSIFGSNEYRGMHGGEKYEPTEANPMIGYRGCFRNISESDLFGIELAAIAQVRAQGMTHLQLMIPFVRTAWEFSRCKALNDQSGLTADQDFELWVMAEVPSILYHLADYQAAGITGVSIGSNDLTQLMLGVDRDSEMLAALFNERDAAVLGAIHDIICACRRLGLTSSICGQAPSVYPDLCETTPRALGHHLHLRESRYPGIHTPFDCHGRAANATQRGAQDTITFADPLQASTHQGWERPCVLMLSNFGILQTLVSTVPFLPAEHTQHKESIFHEIFHHCDHHRTTRAGRHRGICQRKYLA